MKNVTVREAERITNKSRQYIYKLMKDGLIQTHEENGTKYVDLLELLTFIERNRKKERWERERQKKANATR